MAFCSNCGTEIKDGAKFCSECGVPIASEDSKRETTYDGETHKCPNCGEILGAFVSVCPTCGHELRGASISSSLEQFSRKIEQASSDEQKVTLIRSFPIPNTKEDIFEFLILASTNISGEQQMMVFDAWIVKFEQSYQKAQLVIQNPVEIEKIKKMYEETQKRIGKEKLVRNAKAVAHGVKVGTVTISKSGNLVKQILLLIAKSAGVIAGIVMLFIAVNTDKHGGNSSMQELVGVILLIASAATLSRRNASFVDILIGAGSGILSFFLSKLLDNGSMLELGGFVVLIIVAVSFFRKLSGKTNHNDGDE